MTSQTRIVVTGMGTINPLGQSVEETWAKIQAGESGIDCLTRVDVHDMDSKIGGEIKGFDPVARFGHREARRMDRYTQIAMAAALQAWEQSGNAITPDNEFDVGVLMSAGFGGAETIEENFMVLIEQGAARIRPMAFPMSISNIASAQIAILLGIHGINFSISAACSTSSNAIGEGAEIIKRGDAKVIIAGGSEAGLARLSLSGLNAMRALSTYNDTPKTASRPFDATRDGFVPSEGSAAVVLESADYALARGATILAELVGYGTSCDAAHVSAPDPSGRIIAHAMGRAIEKAGIAREQIGYVNAHATSTVIGDLTETRAIKQVFGDYAYHVPISSTKSMTGHPMSAAGALEAIFAMLALRDGVLPPTMNLEHPDPECDLDYIPNAMRRAELEYTMSNSFGFGGHNSVLVFKAWQP